jgi:hypothetical protein
MVDLNLKTFYEYAAREIHASNVAAGWWDDPDECLYQKLQMVSTEVSEATEGARKNLMDTHLTHRKMEEVEYADAMIRILDIGGKLQLEYFENEDPHYYCLPTSSVGKQHLGINAGIVEMSRCVRTYSNARDRRILKLMTSEAYSVIVNSILKVASNRNCDVISAMHEKRAYNAQRADHKRENREQTNGKKF